MKRIIDISEEDFKKIEEDSRSHLLDRYCDLVAHSTPLNECNDCISRTDAIKLLESYGSVEITNKLKGLPSVYPKSDKAIAKKCACYNCKYFDRKGMSHCTIHEDCYGDTKCFDYIPVTVTEFADRCRECGRMNER